jgi:hypothetical protein
LDTAASLPLVHIDTIIDEFTVKTLCLRLVFALDYEMLVVGAAVKHPPQRVVVFGED